MKRRRVAALLGGAFDPPHRGHAALARRALADLPVSRVFLIPNGAPPHRPPPRIPWRRRAEMCAAAVKNIARARVGRDEPPGAPRWTIAAVRRYKNRRWKVVLILGADVFADFHRWRRWREILQLANIAVARRGGFGCPRAAVRARMRILKTARPLAGGAGGVLAWRFRPPDISSTMIRRAAERAKK
ncbi:MAG: nicotinate-nicotinamide nucleotide adenylyltransferase [Betaproteobacteria bacterium]|nr:nicotinate-nicotinamide nucleotide adenylyltransferase [Betaproteobacteria bacterium]